MRIFAIAFLFLFTGITAYSQGCSDAGFCTMGAMKPDQPFNKKVEFKLRTMEVSFYRGTTTLTPIIYVATVDMSFSLGRKSSLQVKLPYQAAQGRLANTNSLGDISLCYTRNIYSADRFDINLSFGTKLATNNSNFKDEEGNPLPMYYQTSLGTYDLIAGVSMISRKWLLATGIQVPLNQNGNKFDWHRWPQNDPVEFAYVQQYPNSTDLKRGVDVMLRVERNFRLSRFNFSVGLLPIYRVVSDYVTRNADGARVNYNANNDVAEGLAMSWITTAGYNFNVRSGVRLLVGHKIAQRAYSPDGLTRELVTSFTYIYRF